jgi:uncharacterized protein (DUF1501 family)
MSATRRRFLQSTLGASALLSTSATVPWLLGRTAAAVERGTGVQGNGGKAKGERLLVVVQLSGGNDGLNTVIPYADDLYAKNRIALNIDRNSVLKLDGAVGLHPSMKAFQKLLDKTRLAVLQGVGYPNPDRSHFSSMDIWHTAERDEAKRQEGWLGKTVTAEVARRRVGADASGTDAAALHLGGGPLPLALVSRSTAVPSFESIDGFRLRPSDVDAKTLATVAAAPREGSEMLAFLQRTTLNAYSASERVQAAIASQPAGAKYPDRGLARKLRSVAQLIDADMATRVYYVSLDGFDTHANQRQSHANLLEELSDSVAAFLDDLAERGHLERTAVLMFSEFGRRVKENASQGTDHGAAAPMFVAGGGVQSGVLGKHPSLSDLDREGDMRFHTDFRRVYATLLDGWLGVPSREVLGAAYEALPILKA